MLRIVPFFALASLIVSTLAPAADERLKLPTPEAVEKTTKEVRTIFKDDYVKTSPKAKVALAEKLLEQGLETKDDPTARFVLFREAADLAAAGGDIDLALRAYETIQAEFKGSVAELQEPILRVIVNRAITAEANLALTVHLLRAIEEAIAADDLDGAGRLLVLANTTSARTRNARAISLVGARGKDIEAFKRESENVKAAIKTLEGNSSDPAACLVVGKYHCFQRGDWMKGLPLLARSSDEKLKAAATKDLANPDEPGELVAAADAWFDALVSVDAAGKRAVHSRAYKFYTQALPGLTGLAKARTEKRIDEIEKVMEGKWEHGDLWVTLRTSIRTDGTEDLREVGGAFGNKPYRELPPEGALLIGFNYTLGNAFGGDIINYCQPIYLTAAGEKTGAMIGKPKGKVLTVKAKTNYAIGTMKVRGGGMWEGCIITFMRIDGKGLKATDKYESSMIGRKVEGFSADAGDGRPVVGVHGKLTNEGDVCSIGFTVAGSKKKK